MPRFFCACRRMEAMSTLPRYPRCRPCPGCGTTLAEPLTARESPVGHQFERDTTGQLRCRICEQTAAMLASFQPTA